MQKIEMIIKLTTFDSKLSMFHIFNILSVQSDYCYHIHACITESWQMNIYKKNTLYNINLLIYRSIY